VDTLNPGAVKCVRSEINILSEMGAQSNVIGFVHVKEFVNYIIMAMEYAKGGTV